MKEHALCSRVVKDLPFLVDVSTDVLGADNTIWRDAHVREAGSGLCLFYTSEADIVFFVRRFLKDILLALDLRLNFSSEVTIKQIRPDISVISMGMYLVGVIEVKKPGGNVLLQPTVLGELLDQMLLVEGFYGMGPVIGILTTAEEWMVSWFPVDSDALASTAVLSEPSFSTPHKSASSTTTELTDTHRRSPPGTPSQQSGSVHTIEVIEGDSVCTYDDNKELYREMDRVLYTTEVMDIRRDTTRVIELLCSAFQLMASAHTHYHANLSRCLLKFHKGITAVTFHPMSHEDVHSAVDYGKFPSRSVKTLVALEDLGRGSTGKAWLCVTVTKPRSAVCVLKFDNKQTSSGRLESERDMWNLLYPEFSHMIKVESWSGADALVMPHFSTVLEHEREQYRNELYYVLTAKFVDKGKVHKDVRWRNIGKYRDKMGKVVIVVFDLHDVTDFDGNTDSNWVDNAMMQLYADV